MVSCYDPYKKDHCKRREYHHCEDYDRCDHCDDKDRKKGKNCIPILECGSPIDSSLPPIMLALTDPPVPLATVTINTKCLCKACVKIEYSSIITTTPINPQMIGAIELKFRLVKECKNKKGCKCEKEILQVWEYREAAASNAGAQKEAFTVHFCECLDCFDEDCCKYTVELIEVSVSNASYNITNRQISALGTCESRC